MYMLHSVLPGGQHADGLTYDAIVVLSDGVYIELIAFVHDVDHYPAGSVEREHRENHWWADKQYGWLDWANIAVERDIGAVINKRANAEIYKSPMESGRTKPDGTELRFRATFPAPTYGGRALPVFAEDLTSRDLRVSRCSTKSDFTLMPINHIHTGACHSDIKYPAYMWRSWNRTHHGFHLHCRVLRILGTARGGHWRRSRVQLPL